MRFSSGVDEVLKIYGIQRSVGINATYKNINCYNALKTLKFRNFKEYTP